MNNIYTTCFINRCKKLNQVNKKESYIKSMIHFHISLCILKLFIWVEAKKQPSQCLTRALLNQNLLTNVYITMLKCVFLNKN